MPTSIEYDTRSPDERWVPDFQIVTKEDIHIPLEVTGTKQSRGKDDVWLRDDKFEFVENHQTLDCWAAYVLENKNLTRFLRLEKKERFTLTKIPIGGVTETYRLIPEDSEALLTPLSFKDYLTKKRGI